MLLKMFLKRQVSVGTMLLWVLYYLLSYVALGVNINLIALLCLVLCCFGGFKKNFLLFWFLYCFVFYVLNGEFTWGTMLLLELYCFWCYVGLGCNVA